jgi:hypothetical protein
LNKTPHKENEETPYEIWMGRKSSYKYLKVWGCLAKVLAPALKVQRIGHKTVDCIFNGYAHNSSAYWFLVHEFNNPDIHKNTILESRNPSFFENVFPCLRQEHTSSSTAIGNVVHEERHGHLEAEEVEPRRSK